MLRYWTVKPPSHLNENPAICATVSSPSTTNAATTSTSNVNPAFALRKSQILNGVKLAQGVYRHRNPAASQPPHELVCVTSCCSGRTSMSKTMSWAVSPSTAQRKMDPDIARSSGYQKRRWKLYGKSLKRARRSFLVERKPSLCAFEVRGDGACSLPIPQNTPGFVGYESLDTDDREFQLINAQPATFSLAQSLTSGSAAHSTGFRESRTISWSPASLVPTHPPR